MGTYTCEVEGEMPPEYQAAGMRGRVEVNTGIIGWVTLEAIDWSGGACGCEYRIMETHHEG